MKRKIFAAGLFIAMSLMVGCSLKNEEEEKPVLVIGSEMYEPYNYVDYNGNNAGIDVEIATEACRRMGYEIKFKYYDSGWADTMLEKGEIDCIWGCYTMDGREDSYQWAGPYMLCRQVVAVEKDSDIYTLDDLSGKNVAVMAGTTPEQILLEKDLTENPKMGTIYSFADIKEAAMALQGDYVDACAGHAAILAEKLLGTNIEYRFLGEGLLLANMGVAFSKDADPDVTEKLNDVLNEMIEDGTIHDILESYGLDADKALEVRE